MNRSKKPGATVIKRPFQKTLYLFTLSFLFFSCDNYFKNDYKDNSPTSGRLKVYYDEGLQLHVKNQARTFTALYPKANLQLNVGTEKEAIKALYEDSCEAILTTRLLSEDEKKAFASKQFNPKFSAVAFTGVALITNYNSPFSSLSINDVEELLTGKGQVKDSTGKEVTIKAIIDRNGSAVLHYLVDSVAKQKKLSANCAVLKTTEECIHYVASQKNTVAFIDFSWLSDSDDSLYKAHAGKIRFVGVKKAPGGPAEFPSQSSFKLLTYPFIRTVYIMRKTGDFSLAKGFESFVAGPKGQLTFLKQGLLPFRQAERVIEVKMEPLNTE